MSAIKIAPHRIHARAGVINRWQKWNQGSTSYPRARGRYELLDNCRVGQIIVSTRARALPKEVGAINCPDHRIHARAGDLAYVKS